MKHSKRKNYFIKKNFQAKLIFWYFLLATGGCIVLITLLGLFSAPPLVTTSPDNIYQRYGPPLVLLQKILVAHWLIIVITAVAVVFFGMFFTHRIAGPLFRFEKSLDNMLNRKLNDTIRLRHKDEGKKLAVQINDFNRDLSLTFRNIKVNSEAIEDLLEQVRDRTDSLPPEQRDELFSLFWSMAERNKRIKAVYSSYTLWDE